MLVDWLCWRGIFFNICRILDMVLFMGTLISGAMSLSQGFMVIDFNGIYVEAKCRYVIKGSFAWLQLDV